MRKLLVLIISLLCATNAHAINVLGYPSSVATRMSTERTLPSGYGTYFTNRANSTSTGNEGDYGQWDAWMYRQTGNTSYANQAYSFWNYWYGYSQQTGAGGPFDMRSQCKPDTGCDRMRDTFGRGVITWSQVCGGSNPGLSAAECNAWGSVFDLMADVTMHRIGNFGFVNYDSDELVGIYLGIMLYAAAIENDNPARANQIKAGTALMPGCCTLPLGWLNDTTSGSYRSKLRSYALRFLTGTSGATWMESSHYNLNTDYYLIYFSWILNQHYGVDYFPEITSQYNNISWFYVNELAPSFQQRYQWGDEQEPRYVHWNKLLPTILMMAKLTTNSTYAANLLYIANSVFDPSNGRYWDPFAAFMDSTSTRTAPSGVTGSQAEGLGILFYHSGWNGNDSFFASQKGAETGAQHSPNRITSFTLFRNGNWAIRHPIIYNEDVDLPYLNGTMPLAGGFARWSEAWDQVLSELGNNYAYHVGVAGGVFGFYTQRNDNPGFPEQLHEFTNTTFYYHHSNGADTIISFDRLNANFPSDFSVYYSAFQAGMSQYNGKHVFKVNAENQPTCASSRCTWTASNGETIYLDTFMSSKTFQTPNYGGGDIGNWGTTGGSNGDTRWQARIIDEDRSTQHQVLINIVHAGTNPTNTELTASVGENAKGVKTVTGSETLVFIANGANRTSDLPTPTAIGAGYNGNKLTQLKALHWFKTGFTLSFSSTGNTNTFIADLNPSVSWTLAVDGGAAQTIVPSTKGLYSTVVTGSGSHTLVVAAGGATTPTCAQSPDYCANQSTCQAATWCWEDRGSGFDCYTSCTPITPPAQCAIDRPDLCTDQTSCNAISGLKWCNGTCTVGTTCPTFNGTQDASCMYAYNFDETSGHFDDISPHNFTTQSEVGITYGQSGVTNNSIYCDETNSLVTIPYDSLQNRSTGQSITITWWAKDAASIVEGGQILNNETPNYLGNYGANYGVKRGTTRNLIFYYENPTSASGTNIWRSANNVFVSDTWKFFALTYTFGTGSSLHLYVGDSTTDVSEVSGSWTSGDGNSSVAEVPTNFTVCGLTGDNNETYKGNLDNLAVFNRILTAAEIAQVKGAEVIAPDNCASGVLADCTNQASCETQGGFWYNNVCNVSPQKRSVINKGTLNKGTLN